MEIGSSVAYGAPARARPVYVGSLAGDGSAMVHALVYLREVPQAPPLRLSEVVTPLRAADGAARDWRLNRSVVIAQPEQAAAVSRRDFIRWRDTFVQERLIGDTATMRAFAAWAERYSGPDNLRTLALPHVELGFQASRHLAWRLGELAALCRASGELGIGLRTPERAGLIRGFRAEPAGVELLRLGGAAVLATVAGLTITDPERGIDPAQVRGWQVADGAITIATERGPLVADRRGVGALLTQLAPGHDEVQVEPATLSAVFAGAFGDLRELAQLAERTRRTLVLSRAAEPAAGL